MFPTSTYDRFRQEILSRYPEHSEKDFITFGILLADARQTESREYILNYIDRFHRLSGKFFDFFIPGYDKHNSRKESFFIRNTEFFFHSELFDEFCDKLEKNFSIHYTYNPMLILMTMQKGYEGTSKHIVIELDEIGCHGVRRSGELFEALFNASKNSVELKDLRNGLVKPYLEGDLLEFIINEISPVLCEIKKIYNEVKRYRLK